MTTIEINGTGGILEGNLEAAAINVNTDPVLDFDGTNDYVHAANHASLNVGTGDYTLSCWFKTTDTDQKFLMGKGSGGGGGKRYNLYIDSGGELATEIDDDGTKTSWNGSTTVEDGSWHHAALTVDRNSATGGQLYLDGHTDGAATNVTSSQLTLDDTGKKFAIGILSDDESTDAFDGQMADVRLYKEALSSDDIKILASKINGDSSLLSAGTTNLSAWWKLNEGTGTSAADSSANSNTGTATNFAMSGTSSNWLFDAFSVNVQDNTTTTDGAVTVTQGKLEGLSLSHLNFDGDAD